MQATEITTDFHYLFSANPNPDTTILPMNLNNSPAIQFDVNTLANPFYHLNMNPHVQDFNLQSMYFGSNSTSDEADEQQMSLINERKHRRMISNRESARRSRMRKQKHLDELRSQVTWLRNENHQLIDKLNNFLETHDCAVRENAQLKEEVSGLRQMVADMQLNETYPNLSDLDDINCDDAYLRTESSNQSVSSSSIHDFH
ncbi:basic leucine zipper 43-like [Rutidosis leptorrhynchoides]|uniref:basic leucine zipper 43-like n=1 Tax=Rutidosis leptorrhynchoides TaxID=125765 RepID=UPI003A994CB6